eukprot:gb/GECH01014833.1/.p1 GENE.gb/GECH01014833.1/~~gb/GECH01014833.1/.p1  ORF type:complete len:560 (+),score=128.47 gb/GECH01014833.1/:1-1680(+)
MNDNQQKAQLGKFLAVTGFIVINLICYVILGTLQGLQYSREALFVLFSVIPLFNLFVILVRFGDFLHYIGILSRSKAIDYDSFNSGATSPYSSKRKTSFIAAPDRKSPSTPLGRSLSRVMSFASPSSRKQSFSYQPVKEVVVLVPIYKESVSELMRTILSFEENAAFDRTLKLTILMIVDGKDDELQQKAISYLRLHFRLSRKGTIEFENNCILSATGKEDSRNAAHQRGSSTRSLVDIHTNRSYPVAQAVGEKDLEDAEPNTLNIHVLAKHKNGGKFHSQKLFFAYLSWAKVAEQFVDAKALLMVDSDTRLKKDTIRLLYDRLIGGPHYLAGVCGEVVEESGEAFLSNWHQALLNAQFSEFKSAHWVSKRMQSLFGCVTCLPGCCSMYKMEALEDHRVVDKFTSQDPQTLFEKLKVQLGEDRYLTLLLLHAGYTTCMVPEAKSYTRLSEDLRRFLIVRKRWTNSTVANNLSLIFNLKAWLPTFTLKKKKKKKPEVMPTSLARRMLQRRATMGTMRTSNSKRNSSMAAATMYNMNNSMGDDDDDDDDDDYDVGGFRKNE